MRKTVPLTLNIMLLILGVFLISSLHLVLIIQGVICIAVALLETKKG